MAPQTVYSLVNGTCTKQPPGTDRALHDCCSGGLIFRGDVSRNAGMGILWVLLLCWTFMGVALGADAFMSSIETITSQLKMTTVVIKGEKKKFHARVWNDTVANLTLMALGSSAPEILLSMIEIAFLSDKGLFYSGDLGPSTIIGSAAFNLMIITGVCIVAIPKGETRTLKHPTVFGVTASFSIFAYLWLVVVLVAWTPNIITIEEAALTFAFMALLVGIAYLADKGYLSPKGAYASSSLKVLSVSGSAAEQDALPAGATNLTSAEIARYLTVLEKGGSTVSEKGDAEEGTAAAVLWDGTSGAADGGTGTRTASASGSGGTQARAQTAEQIAAAIIAEQQANRPRSRTEHRSKALEGLTGGMTFSRSMPKKKDVATIKELEGSDVTLEEVERTSFVGFVAPLVNVVEGDDEYAVLQVARAGCLEGSFTVHYATGDGTAKAGSDYDAAEGDLTFGPNETSKEVKVKIIDDDEIEDDEEFYVTLSAPKMAEGSDVKPKLGGPKLHMEACVLIKDDDKLPGTLSWKASAVRCAESDGKVFLTVERKRGHNGEISVKYDTRPKEALEGADYIGAHGELAFAHGELSQTIEIEIVNDSAYEKDERFLVVLSEPSGGAIFREDTDGRGDQDICTVTIESDDKMKSKIDRVARLLSVDRQKAGMLGSAWKEQVEEALFLDEEARTPKGYFMHALMLPWKLLFGILPPADAFGGWGLFVCSLLGIMLQVMLIGDLASQTGCIVGLRDSVTAITVVALGTSLPDLFASMKAACDDPTADNSVGNVTGSNSVNVFMGLGLPWLVASIYWAGVGPTEVWKSHYPALAAEYPQGGFVVCAGSLAFSVTVFTIVAIITLCSILARRFFLHPAQELGGDKKIAYMTFAFFIVLYFTYLVFSILRAESIGGFEYFLLEYTQSPDCPI